MANLGVRSEVSEVAASLLLAFFETGVAGRSKLVLELLNAACRIDKLQLAGVERVAHVADVYLQLFARAASRKRVPTTTVDTSFMIFRMNVSLHRDVSLARKGVSPLPGFLSGFFVWYFRGIRVRRPWIQTAHRGL
jgi:hypothetical protein